MLIKTLNNLDVSASYDYLSMGEASGASTLRVKNINPFYANWAVQIGKTGEKQSEIVVITSSPVSGTSFPLTGTARYAHAVDTPVYATKFDQIVFKRSTVGTAGTATAMTNGTITITPDSPYTIFDDTTGAATYAYKTAFYNSITTESSSDSDWITSAGYSFYSLAKMRDRVRKKLYNNDIVPDDERINDWINEWLEGMTNSAIKVNKAYSLGTVDVGFGTSGLGTITSTDFKEIARFWVTYDAGVTFVRAAQMEQQDISPQQTFNAITPFFSYFGDNIFQIKPDQMAGTARLAYYKMNPVLVNDTDELPVSMRSYSKSFVDYALAQALYVDQKADVAGQFLGAAETEKARFTDEITPRHKTGIQTIHFTNLTSGEDTGYLEYM